MCDFCEKNGIDGGRWYYNPANFARRLYKVRSPKGKEMTTNPSAESGMTPPVMYELIDRKAKNPPEEYGEFVGQINALRMGTPQVITTEETKQIMDIAWPLVKMTCVCRRGNLGLADELNFTCMGLGSGMYKWERWPQIYKGGVEFVTPAEAKEWVDMTDEKGYVHSVDPHGYPYIGGLCQCDYPTCAAIRGRVDYDLQMLRKAHYVAKVNTEKCNGCRRCVSRCQFKSLNFEACTEKAVIDMFSCYGCGLCASVCKPGAIELLEREKLPSLRDNW